MTKRGRKPYQRGVDPQFPKNNRYRRLVSLCGLSGPEAAGYLDLAPKTAEQKSLGARGIAVEEERALLALWRRIRDRTQPLDHTMPTGARMQQLAFWEAQAILAGEIVTEEDVAWDLGGEGDDDAV